MSSNPGRVRCRRWPAAEQVAAAVAVLVDSLAGGAVADLTHDQLSALVTGVRRAGARLESVTLTAVGEVDARGTFTLDGALTAGAWLRQTTRVTAGEAAGLVRTARVLRSGLPPATAAALAGGGLTGRHAGLIATAVADAPAGAVALIEPDAVAVASTADVAATANLMRGLWACPGPRQRPMRPRSAGTTGPG